MNNYYRLGLTRPSSIKPGMRIVGLRTPPDPRIGGWVATPGVIRDEIDQLNSEITTADKEMIGELFEAEDKWGYHIPKADASKEKLGWYHAVWRPFHTDWNNFRAKHLTTLSNMWGSTWDLIQEYRKRFIGIYDSGKGIGMVFLGPSPTPPKEGPITQAGKEAWGVVKTVVYVLLVMAGGIVLMKLLDVQFPGLVAVGRR